MERAVSTLRLLAKAGAKVVIISHRGRPQKFEKGLSLKRDALILSRMLRRRIFFIPHFRTQEIRRAVSRGKPGSVFLLENLRFLKGEDENSPILAKKLASLGDYYVNDAFAVSHRENASVVAITRCMKSYAGLGLEDELIHLGHVMRRPKHPLVMILGGAKAGDKLKVVHFFRRKADAFILGGALSNSVLKFNGINIGDSIYDNEANPAISEIIKYKNLHMPFDYVIREKKILDLGPKTLRMIEKKVHSARTIIWNGPLGHTEEKKFSAGTLALARAIARNRRAFSLAGGGETVAFIRKYKLDKKFTFISTGGGAMLDFLAGKKLPGIEALKNSR